MKIVAAFAFRDDQHLVPDLLINLQGMIDDYVCWDDRANAGIYCHEGRIRNHLIQEAKDKGADWILGIDPDERFEKDAGKQVRELTKEKQKLVYSFRWRELWSPSHYRVDGIWAHKIKPILFPVYPGQTFMNRIVHSFWFPMNEGYERRDTGLNLYHLKMISPQARETRRRIYNQVDPCKEFQRIGYDYLVDETGLQLEQIRAGREYLPSFSCGHRAEKGADSQKS